MKILKYLKFSNLSLNLKKKFFLFLLHFQIIKYSDKVKEESTFYKVWQFTKIRRKLFFISLTICVQILFYFCYFLELFLYSLKGKKNWKREKFVITFWWKICDDWIKYFFLVKSDIFINEFLGKVLGFSLIYLGEFLARIFFCNLTELFLFPYEICIFTFMPIMVIWN